MGPEEESFDGKESPKVKDLDHVLTLLSTGPWNIFIWVICSCSEMIIPANVLASAFVAPPLNHTCVPPVDHVATADQCWYSASDNNDTSLSLPCTQWLYDDSLFKLTATAEFDLVCDRAHYRPLLSSIYMTGSLCGSLLGGYLSDRHGRKFTCLLSMVVYSSLNLIYCWLPSLTAIVALRFIMGVCQPVLLSSIYILIMEVCESRHRSVVGIISGMPWGLGTMLYGAVAYFIRNWRWLHFAMALPALLLVPALWLIVDESPRWLVVQGRHDQAMAVLQRAQAWNKTTLPDEQQLREVMLSTQETALSFNNKKSKLKQSLQELSSLMNKVVRTRVLVLWTLYTVSVLVYYGLSLGGVSMNVNPFAYMVLTGLMELPSYSIAAPIVARWGRRDTTAINYGISGIAVLILAFIPSDIGWLTMTLAMVGKLCITAAFQIIYLYSMELLPTEIRTTSLGSCVFVSGLGLVATPYISDTLSGLISWAPSVLFGVSSVGAGLLTLLLPETRGRPMVDTLAEMDPHREAGVELQRRSSKAESLQEQGA